MCAVLGVILGQLTFTSHSFAEIAVSSLESPAGTTPVVDSNQSVGMRFTTDSDLWRLDSVQLAAGDFVGMSTAPFVVSLYSVSGNIPGTKLMDFTGANPSTFGTYTFTASSEFILQPSTSYFIVASSTENASFYVWGSTDATSFTALPGWTLVPGNAVTSGGVNWAWNTGPNTPMAAVNVTAVPEPSALVLASLGLIALGAHRFARRSVRLG
jgi:hypothetical protein